MREVQEIKHELDAAQTNLENDLAELRDVIHDKLDIKAHARRAVSDLERKASEAASRGRYQLEIWYADARSYARKNPRVIAGMIGGALVLGAAVLIVKRRS